MSEETNEEVTEQVEEEAPKKRVRKTRKPRKEAVPQPVPVATKVKRYSFDKWASRRGVKQHHKAGLKAYVKNANKPRTLEEWDKAFKGY